MAGTRSKNFDLARFVAKTKTGAYKYQRRVPPELQEFLQRKVWDYSLGSDATEAARRGIAYADEHDATIAALKTPVSRANLAARQENESAAKITELALVMGKQLGAEESGVNIDAAVWRRTESAMMTARTMPQAAERDRLALFAAYAFGDRSYIERMPVDDPFGNALAAHLTPAPPTDPLQAAMFKAYKGALDARLAEIEPANDPAREMRLSALIAAYSKHQAARPNTIRSYKNKVQRLVDFAQDRALTDYDSAILRDYRDYLLAGDPAKNLNPAKPVTIQQYFAPLKALWKWAAVEYPDLKGLNFPQISLPKSGETVEETRWQAFDTAEIKTVWRLINDAWGDTSKSKMAPARRKAFLMAFRVLLHTGMRPAEVFRLTAADVTESVLNIKYTKTKTPRTIPLAKALKDFPAYLEAGGFTAALEGANPDGLAGTMSETFSAIIRTKGFSNDRHVLYSTKDTLIDRLQQQGVSDDVMRGIIGHVTGGGKLRHYKTPFGQSPHGLTQMRTPLDKITYW